MKEDDKPPQEIKFKANNDLNLTEFYNAINNAISTNNLQSLYGISKIFTRYCFEKLED